MSDESDDLDLSETIAAAIEEQEGEGIIDELVSQSDGAPDTSEPESDKIEAESSDDDGISDGNGESTEQAEEPDSSSDTVASETDTGPERSPEIADAHRQIAEAFGSAVAPYQAHIASKGISSPQAVQALLAAEYQLSTGTPDQKAKIMARLAKDYGVDLDALYEVEEAAPASPEIAQLQQRQVVLERMVNGERQQVAAQMRQDVETQVTAFAEEKDAAGNLLHPHLQQVQVAMGHAIERDPKLTIEQAYQNAVWGDASLREQALGKRRPTAAGKSAKAKASAKPAKEPSLADDLRKQYRRAVERASA